MPPGDVALRELHRQLIVSVKAKGLSTPAPWSDLWRCGWVCVAYAVGYSGALVASSWGWRLAALALTAFSVLQAGFISHDLAHRHLSTGTRFNTFLEQLFMTVMCGQTFGHWLSQHREHHRHSQHVHDDPDLEVSIFALSHQAAATKRGFFAFTTRYQALLLWPALTLQAYSIRLNTIAFMVRHPSATDITFFAVHNVLWLLVPSLVVGPQAALVNYLLLTWLIGPYLGIAFIWNHLGLRSFDDASPEGFVERQLTGARSLLGTRWYSMLFGGLNFHVEHHLAPAVPTARLPEVRTELRALLAQRGLSLTEQTWSAAMRDVQRHLASVGAGVGQRKAVVTNTRTSSVAADHEPTICVESSR